MSGSVEKLAAQALWKNDPTFVGVAKMLYGDDVDFETVAKDLGYVQKMNPAASDVHQDSCDTPQMRRLSAAQRKKIRKFESSTKARKYGRLAADVAATGALAGTAAVAGAKIAPHAAKSAGDLKAFGSLARGAKTKSERKALLSQAPHALAGPVKTLGIAGGGTIAGVAAGEQASQSHRRMKSVERERIPKRYQEVLEKFQAASPEHKKKALAAGLLAGTTAEGLATYRSIRPAVDAFKTGGAKTRALKGAELTLQAGNMAVGLASAHELARKKPKAVTTTTPKPLVKSISPEEFTEIHELVQKDWTKWNEERKKHKGLLNTYGNSKKKGRNNPRPDRETNRDYWTAREKSHRRKRNAGGAVAAAGYTGLTVGSAEAMRRSEHPDNFSGTMDAKIKNGVHVASAGKAKGLKGPLGLAAAGLTVGTAGATYAARHAQQRGTAQGVLTRMNQHDEKKKAAALAKSLTPEQRAIVRGEIAKLKQDYQSRMMRRGAGGLVAGSVIAGTAAIAAKKPHLAEDAAEAGGIVGLATGMGTTKKRPKNPRPRPVGSLTKRQDVTWEGHFSKADEDKRQVFGWASVTHVDGQPVVDLQGDMMMPDELEKAAYDYVLKSRIGGDMHARVGPDGKVISKTDKPHHVADLIESVVFTPEKIEKMGLPDDFPTGWWVGFKVHDDDVWGMVKSGERKGFSIHGLGKRVPVEKFDAGKHRKQVGYVANSAARSATVGAAGGAAGGILYGLAAAKGKAPAAGVSRLAHFGGEVKRASALGAGAGFALNGPVGGAAGAAYDKTTRKLGVSVKDNPGNAPGITPKPKTPKKRRSTIAMRAPMEKAVGMNNRMASGGMSEMDMQGMAMQQATEALAPQVAQQIMQIQQQHVEQLRQDQMQMQMMAQNQNNQGSVASQGANGNSWAMQSNYQKPSTPGAGPQTISGGPQQQGVKAPQSGPKTPAFSGYGGFTGMNGSQ